MKTLYIRKIGNHNIAVICATTVQIYPAVAINKNIYWSAINLITTRSCGFTYLIRSTWVNTETSNTVFVCCCAYRTSVIISHTENRSAKPFSRQAIDFYDRETKTAAAIARLIDYRAFAFIW